MGEEEEKRAEKEDISSGGSKCRSRKHKVILGKGRRSLRLKD